MEEPSTKPPVSPLTAASACGPALLVEDEVLIRRQVVKALESLAVQVHGVGTVADAQGVLASESIALSNVPRRT